MDFDLGAYFNIGNSGFRRARNSEYVDKSMLIDYVNKALDTEHNMMCVTRSRRFGKSMAAKMLCAYYDKSCSSCELFDDLKIAKSDGYKKHLNKYNVIYLDITDFITRFRTNDDIVEIMQKMLADEICNEFGILKSSALDDLMSVLINVADTINEKFIFIIDEWDAICRECGSDVMNKYVDFLRRMFKGANTDKVFAGVYMTGILPIKKYDTQSALNNFEEYSMVSPGQLSPYFGFNKQEVEMLCNKYQMNYDIISQWYDGYKIGTEKAIFNPFSVIKAITRQSIESYWTNTSTYETLGKYISMDFDGLKIAVAMLLSGNEIGIRSFTFSNDINEIKTKDDVLTLLIHLGYLTYNIDSRTVSIPNYEVAQEFENTITDIGWNDIANAINNSEKLLRDTLAGNEDAVAEAIDNVHRESTSILQYNDENSLACVVTLAYYYAKKEYVCHRELPTGNGFADLMFVPKRSCDSPVILIELKYDEPAIAAIEQIKNKHYTDKALEYADNVLLVGISYSSKTKKHICKIERYTRGC